MSDLRVEYNTTAGEERNERVEPDRLIEEIEQIRRRFQGGPDAPYGMDVVSGDGDRMTVGFDDREGFLMYRPASDQEWVRYSMGDPKRNDTKVFYVPQWTELSGKYMVPTRVNGHLKVRSFGQMKVRTPSSLLLALTSS